MIIQKDSESRLEYILRVAIEFANRHSHSTIDYDEATCDGYCLAGDLTNVLECLKEEQQ
ncbi:hypothetical protein D3C85_1292330 [compost metagenome]